LNSPKTPEILHSIAKAYIGFPFSDDAPLPDQVSGADWAPGLISALRQELGVEITPDELGCQVFAWVIGFGAIKIGKGSKREISR
jgi:hypothetical protein